MIREMITLVIDKMPVLYYVKFDRDRQRFQFQASFKNKSAPSFTVKVCEDEIIIEPSVDESIARQAVQKVREIVHDKIFDRL